MVICARIKTGLALLILVLLVGCETTSRKDAAGITHRVDDDISKTEHARSSNDRYLEKESARASRPSQVVKIPRNAQWLRDEVDVKYHDAPVGIAIASVLDGRPFRFTKTPSQTLSTQTTESSQLTLPNGMVVDVPGEVSAGGDEKSLVSNIPEAKTIKQHLDSIASQAGMTFGVENGVVVFSDYFVETFAIRTNTLDLRQEFRFSNQTARADSNNQQLGLYKELREGLQGIVAPPNSFAINQSANSVTVKANQRVMREVRRYIDLINYAAGRRVVIRMDIYDINLSALGQRSFDFNIKELLADSSKLSGYIADIAVAGASQVAIQNPSTQIGIRVEDNQSRLNGATALLKFLRGKGAVTKRTAKEFVVSNNEQINEIRTRITPYVSGVTIDQTNTGISQSNTPSIETREANTGTAIQMHPTISGDRVYIQMTIEDSSLVRFDDFEFGGGEGVGLVSGKLPVTEVAQSQYEFAMIDGETIAVAGSITSSRAHEVVNGSLVPLLGDSVDKSEVRTQSLIFVTSNILD